jgi:hypothetical protein
VVKFDKQMHQDVILSSQNDKDWLKAYDSVLHGKADANVALEDELHWYERMCWISDSVDLSKIILHEKLLEAADGSMDQ